MDYIDMHCDTLLLKNFPERPDTLARNTWSVDFARMREGGCAAQFFAAFLPTPNYFQKHGLSRPSDWDYVSARAEDLRRELEAHDEEIRLALGHEDFRRNRNAGRMSAFFTVEDGRLLEGDLANVERLRCLGVRLVTLTWNHPNCLGFPHSAEREKMSMGLTEFGREAVRAMQKAGITVDVSHLSDGGFWDVLEVSRRPVAASHSNARAVCAHSRNLSDEMIRALADRGGSAGVNLAPEMLCKEGDKSRISDMVRHIRHFINVGGEDFPMIGTDFDGIHGDLEIASCAQMPRLFEALETTGLTAAQIEKLAFGNALRIVREAM